MKYVIKPGSVAAMQHVEADDGSVWDAIFMAEGKEAVIHKRGDYRNVAVYDEQGRFTGRTNEHTRDNALPMPVVAAVNKYFGMMFSLPYERRQALIDATVPQTIDA